MKSSFLGFSLAVSIAAAASPAAALGQGDNHGDTQGTWRSGPNVKVCETFAISTSLGVTTATVTNADKTTITFPYVTNPAQNTLAAVYGAPILAACTKAAIVSNPAKVAYTIVLEPGSTPSHGLTAKIGGKAMAPLVGPLVTVTSVVE